MYTLAKKASKKIGYSLESILKKFTNNNQSNTSIKLQNSPQINDKYLYENYSKESLKNKAFYNVGAGKFYHCYWTNIDYSLGWYARKQSAPFLNINLMEEPDLPIEAESAELFYTSHTIEHLTDSAVFKIFSEAYRALKTKGLFRIVCPDADLIYRTMQLSSLEYWHWRYTFFSKYTDNLDEVKLEDFVVREIATERCRFCAVEEEKKLSPIVIKDRFETLDKTSFLDFLVSKCQYSEEKPNWHINWWNEEKLTTFLKNAGFNTVIRSGYQQSLAAPLHNTQLFDNRCPRISIYVEAIK